MDLDAFYEELNAKFEGKSSSGDLADILLHFLPNTSSDLEEFKAAYESNHFATTNLMFKFIPRLIDIWKFKGISYANIFSSPNHFESEKYLIDSFAKILFAKTYDEKQNAILPKVLSQLVADGYVLEEDLSPPLQDNYPEFDDYAKVFEQNFFHRYLYHEKLYLTPKIHERITQRLETIVVNSESLLHKNGYTQQPLTLDFDELVSQVEEQLPYADRPELLLNSYTAVMKVPRDDFHNNHLTYLSLLLDMEFSYKNFNEFKDEEKIIIGTIPNFKISLNSQEDYSILMFTQSSSSQESSMRLYALKNLFEYYCSEKNIPLYSEQEISEQGTFLMIKKLDSLAFARDNVHRISEQLDNDVISKIIDYFNIDIRNLSFSAHATTLYTCKCGEKVIDGTFSYKADRDYLVKNPNKMDEEITFPLSQLHMVASHPDNYRPRINELQTIEQLIELSKDWQLIDLPKDFHDDYASLYLGGLYHDDASMRQSMFIFDSQAMRIPSEYMSEEEINADPELKQFSDDCDWLYDAPDKFLSAIEPKINRIVDYLIETKQPLPDHWFSEKHCPEDLLKSQYIFLMNQYDSIVSRGTLSKDSPYAHLAKTIKEYHDVFFQFEYFKLSQMEKLDSGYKKYLINKLGYEPHFEKLDEFIPDRTMFVNSIV